MEYKKEPKRIPDVISEEEESDDSNSESETVKIPEEDSKLIDLFQKLYSNFDEDDIELCNDTLRLLEILKEKGCVTESEYLRVKSELAEKIQLNLYESINSTVKNMIRDDKNEIMGLLRSMKKYQKASKLLDMVKDYFEEEEEEMGLESVLWLLSQLKDKVSAQKIKIILNQIEKTKNRVDKIFRRIANATANKKDILNDLRTTGPLYLGC